MTDHLPKLPRRQFLALAAGGIVLPTVSTTARAEAFPTRPVTMIVPFVAGGPADVFGRIMAAAMAQQLGQSVIIENVGGAAGTVATGRVVRAAPDGYTLLVTPGLSTQVINPAIYDLPFDTVKDFVPVALLTSISNIIVAKKTVPADDLKGLIAWLKANPSALQATSGVGSVGHVAGVLFQKETGTKYNFIPYHGLAPALQDLIAGRVDLMIDVPLNSMPYVRDGTLKAYAVFAKKRMAFAPDIPTADEAGVPGLYVPNWYAIYAPKDTPAGIVDKLSTAAMAAVADPAVRKHLADLGHEIFPPEQQTPAGLDALQAADIAKWWPVIKAANIKGE